MEKTASLNNIQIGLSINELLTLSPFCHAHLLTRHTSSEKENVMQTNVIEDPRLNEWACPGDLILTSWNLVSKNISCVTEQIPELRRTGVSGICIKQTPASPDISQKFIAICEACDLPLILLPVEDVFATLVRSCSEAILQKRVSLFNTIQKCTADLLESMWKENDPEKSLRITENYFHNPVIIIDKSTELIITQETKSLLSSASQDDIIRQLYQFHENVTIHVRQNHTDRLIPVHAFRSPDWNGLQILALEWNHAFSPADLIVFQQISNNLVLEMRAILNGKKRKKISKSQLVRDLLNGSLGADSLSICVHARNDGYRLNAEQNYRVIVLNINSDEAVFKQDDAGIIHHVIRNLNASMLFDIQDGKLVLITEDLSDWNQMLNRLKALSEKLNYIMAKGSISLCISKARTLAELPQCYQESTAISHLSSICQIRQPVITSEQLGVLYVLSMLPNDPYIASYIAKYLDPLKHYDQDHNSELLLTLKNYLDSDCNKQQTAERMHTHYNTIVYRINRIEQLLNVSLADVETQFQLRFSLKLELIGYSEGIPAFIPLTELPQTS